MRRKVEIEFKDSDFLDKIRGLTPSARKKMDRKAQFGEFWCVELTVDCDTGEIEGARLLQAGPCALLEAEVP